MSGRSRDELPRDEGQTWRRKWALRGGGPRGRGLGARSRLEAPGRIAECARIKTSDGAGLEAD
eukprot:5733957-Pyramimonas_sp.AAC.1